MTLFTGKYWTLIETSGCATVVTAGVQCRQALAGMMIGALVSCAKLRTQRCTQGKAL